MCIGNRDGGDDAIGPYIADKLKDMESGDFIVLDCSTVPENYTSIVKRNKPKNLIIIDAVEMGINSGEIRIVPEGKIGTMHISTHGIPIPILIKYLKEHVENILLVGIQPKTMSGKISEKIRISADRLVEIIKSKDIDSIEKLK